MPDPEWWSIGGRAAVPGGKTNRWWVGDLGGRRQFTGSRTESVSSRRSVCFHLFAKPSGCRTKSATMESRHEFTFVKRDIRQHKRELLTLWELKLFERTKIDERILFDMLAMYVTSTKL